MTKVFHAVIQIDDELVVRSQEKLADLLAEVQALVGVQGVAFFYGAHLSVAPVPPRLEVRGDGEISVVLDGLCPSVVVNPGPK